MTIPSDAGGGYFPEPGEPGPENPRLHSPAAARNAAAILAVLADRLPARGLVLEIGSGTGEHAAFFASRLPGRTWQPSDIDPARRASIAAYAADARKTVPGTDILAPLSLDASRPPWPLRRADAVVSCNMIHIAPWTAAQGLFDGAARILPAGAALFLYGPMRIAGEHTAPSNAEFDSQLRGRNPDWGIRDLDLLDAAAFASGLDRSELISMPANNHIVIYRRMAV